VKDLFNDILTVVFLSSRDCLFLFPFSASSFLIFFLFVYIDLARSGYERLTGKSIQEYVPIFPTSISNQESRNQVRKWICVDQHVGIIEVMKLSKNESSCSRPNTIMLLLCVCVCVCVYDTRLLFCVCVCSLMLCSF
jgi:hypothetical protein